MNAALFLVFLGRLLRSTTGKLFVIVDRLRAYETPEVKSEARRLKVELYLKKPFDLTFLLCEIHGLIGNGNGTKAG